MLVDLPGSFVVQISLSVSLFTWEAFNVIIYYRQGVVSNIPKLKVYIARENVSYSHFKYVNTIIIGFKLNDRHE